MAADGQPATVTVLTYNGEQYLEDILGACRCSGTTTVLVIDSGCDDPARGAAAPDPQLRHGRTRNLAAELARGNFARI